MWAHGQCATWKANVLEALHVGSSVAFPVTWFSAAVLQRC